MNSPTALRLGPAAAGRCRRRVHLDHAPGAPKQQRTGPDVGVKMRLADMQLHAADVLAGFPAAATGWSPKSGERPAIVLGPTLRTPTRIGTPDLLIAADGGYLPVIVRGHRTLDPGSGALTSPVDDPDTATVDAKRRLRKHPLDVLQLAHLYTMLTELGLASSTARGGVIGRGGGPDGDDGSVIVWHDLAAALPDYAERFADRWAVARAAEDGGELAFPSRIAECRRCPWWPVCSAELEASHDISLLAAGSDVQLLHDAGMTTLDDLVAAPQSELDALQLTSVPPTEARIRAKARLDGVPLVRRRNDPAARRADVELDVDMESYLDAGAYLWGTLLSGADIGFDRDYQAFVSWDGLPGPGEADAFVRFWQFLTEVRTACAARGLSFAAYCWSRAAEERWLYSTPRRFPETVGMPTVEEITAYCTSPQWIDLYAEVKRQFVVPGSMRLKAIAPIAGFAWRDAEPGGENSMAWYRAAVGADGLPPDPAMRQRVLEYNEDDVRATAAIRAWMSDGAAAVPTVAELTAQLDGTASRDAATADP
ncbi:TM0106 family RecB-like putative nuclease [Nakamurella lactea]|uniref:TM0106 family RecB-like putative nuclease n=1 Tax=Nakamurella lactea TaxID=459515 RepID=UPI0003F74487|nr:TM0106 family RecB-like putative nuclease [Nakamurella lactea]